MAPVSQEVHSVSNCNPPHIGIQLFLLLFLLFLRQFPFLLGPAIPEMNSIWFKLWLYHRLGTGPVSLLLTRGTRLTTLPSFFRVCHLSNYLSIASIYLSIASIYPSILCVQRYSKILLTSWGHDHAIINSSNILLSLNEALTHSAVLLQVY